jgi:hypothetical protein
MRRQPMTFTRRRYRFSTEFFNHKRDVLSPSNRGADNEERDVGLRHSTSQYVTCCLFAMHEMDSPLYYVGGTLASGVGFAPDSDDI